MLKLKLQYFGHLMWHVGKDPDTMKDWRQKEKEAAEDEMVREHHWQIKDMTPSKFRETVKDRGAWSAAVQGVTNSQTWLSDWTTPCFRGNTVSKDKKQKRKRHRKEGHVKVEGKKMKATCLQVKRCHRLPDASRSWQRGMAWIFCLQKDPKACWHLDSRLRASRISEAERHQVWVFVVVALSIKGSLWAPL